MFSKVNSLGLEGYSAELVEVEADLSSGLPRFDLVGLPSTAVSESKERVRSAIKNCGLKFPISRITVNLAPAEFKKDGPIYDLPILIAILKASGQLKGYAEGSCFIGELSLDGNLRRINGVLPMAIRAKQLGIKNFFIPHENLSEALLVPGISVYPLKTLQSLLSHFDGTAPITPMSAKNFHSKTYCVNAQIPSPIEDFNDVIGQHTAKRALEVAAAGGHNVLLVGSPGSGKSMLAKRVPTILPDMTFSEMVETTSVYSVAGKLCSDIPIITKRPFRSPHHTATETAMTGGGRKATPGEISLAHNGVLFLDELPLFSHSVLESLRQPLEDRHITVTRNAYTAEYPANLILICAMNPCPCGFLMDPLKECNCTEKARHAYISKISGPFLDRIDITVYVKQPDCEQFVSSDGYKSARLGESSTDILARVNAARKIQRHRFINTDIYCNAQMSSTMAHEYCQLTDNAEQLLISAFKSLGFSARAHDKILKTARTIADLDEKELIDISHVSEAIQYRQVNFDGISSK